MQIETLKTLVAEAIAPIAGNGVDASFYDGYGLKCGLAAAEAVLKQNAAEIPVNGWKIERYDGQYIYLSFEGKPGVIQIKAESEGFVVDAFVAGMEEESVSTMAVEYSDLESEHTAELSNIAESSGGIATTAKLRFVNDCV